MTMTYDNLDIRGLDKCTQYCAHGAFSDSFDRANGDLNGMAADSGQTWWADGVSVVDGRWSGGGSGNTGSSSPSQSIEFAKSISGSVEIVRLPPHGGTFTIDIGLDSQAQTVTFDITDDSHDPGGSLRIRVYYHTWYFYNLVSAVIPIPPTLPAVATFSMDAAGATFTFGGETITSLTDTFNENGWSLPTKFTIDNISGQSPDDSVLLDTLSIAGFDPCSDPNHPCYRDCSGGSMNLLLADDFNDRGPVSDYRVDQYNQNSGILGSTPGGPVWSAFTDIGGWSATATVGINDNHEAEVVASPAYNFGNATYFRVWGANALMSGRTDFVVSMRVYIGQVPAGDMDNGVFAGIAGAFDAFGWFGMYSNDWPGSSFPEENGKFIYAAGVSQAMDWPFDTWGDLKFECYPGRYARVSFTTDTAVYAAEGPMPAMPPFAPGPYADEPEIVATYNASLYSTSDTGTIRFDDFKLFAGDCVDVTPEEAPAGVSGPRGKTCDPMSRLSDVLFRGVVGYRAGSTEVWVNGRLMKPVADYSESSPDNGDITFSGPVPSGASVWMCYVEIV